MWVSAAGDAGPDMLRSAASRSTSCRSEAVRLDVAETGALAELPVSVVTTFRNAVQQFPDQIALGLFVCLFVRRSSFITLRSRFARKPS